MNELEPVVVSFVSVDEAEQRLRVLKDFLFDVQQQLDDPSRMEHKTVYEYQGWRRRAKSAFFHARRERKAIELWLRRNRIGSFALSLKNMLLHEQPTDRTKAAIEALQALCEERKEAGCEQQSGETR